MNVLYAGSAIRISKFIFLDKLKREATGAFTTAARNLFSPPPPDNAAAAMRADVVQF